MSIRDENGIWKQEASELSDKIQKTLENILYEVLDAGLTVEDFYYLVGTEADSAITRYSIFRRKKEREMKKKTLIVIDMQNDFVAGVLGSKEAVAILPNVKKKIQEYATEGHRVIFTRDTHRPNYLETNEGKHLPVVHCIMGTDGWQIVDGLEIPNCEYIDKPTFGYKHWDEKGFKDVDVEIIGVCTDICVVSNAMILKAQYPEINITVDASCCAGVTPETHKAALETMKMCQINVINE